MNLKQWTLGCLNSGIKQAAKLGLSIFTAFTIGSHLDVRTLAITVSVGFAWGVGEWLYSNPIPDETTVKTISLAPDRGMTVSTSKTTTPVDKIDK